MINKGCRVHIRKDALKFSAAHIIVFPDGTKGSLHGHNYTTEVTVDIKGTSLREMVSFSQFKSVIREICQQWDEKILLPKLSPYLRIQCHDPKEIDFLMCGKRYVMPTEE